jgi:hypothetical protein
MTEERENFRFSSFCLPRGGINAIPNLLKKYRMSGKIPDLAGKIPD